MFFLTEFWDDVHPNFILWHPSEKILSEIKGEVQDLLLNVQKDFLEA